jgi:hypothetical protein
VQATVAAVLPASHTKTLGHQIQTNIAFQYHLLDVLWPEIEVNWTKSLSRRHFVLAL